MNIVMLDTDTLGYDLDFSIYEKYGNVTKYGMTLAELAAERVKNADIVIFDTSSELSLFKLTLFEMSEKVIVPIKGDLTSVLRTGLLQDIWRQSGFASSKLNLILNMKDKKTSLSEDEIEKNCGAKVICSIPDFGAEFRKKCNEGILPVKMRGKIKKIFLEAAEKILNY